MQVWEEELKKWGLESSKLGGEAGSRYINKKSSDKHRCMHPHTITIIFQHIATLYATSTSCPVVWGKSTAGARPGDAAAVPGGLGAPGQWLGS